MKLTPLEQSYLDVLTQLMRDNGLDMSIWSCAVNGRLRSTLARCRWFHSFKNKALILGRIELSRYVIKNACQGAMIDIMLHEIAHALCGYDADHGSIWKATAKRLGARPYHTIGSLNLIRQTYWDKKPWLIPNENLLHHMLSNHHQS